MIKVENGTLKIDGAGLELQSDLATIVHGLQMAFTKDGVIPAEYARRYILDAVEQGFKTKEELHEEIDDMLKDIMMDFMKRGIL